MNSKYVLLLIVHLLVGLIIGETVEIAKSNSNHTSHIINGSPVSPDQYPYYVGLFVRGKMGGFTCGAAYLNSKTIITTAHCPYGFTARQLYIRQTNNETRPSQPTESTAPITSIKPHPAFDYTTGDNDIALLYIDNALPGWAPIAIPQNESASVLGELATVIGYGVTRNTSPPSHILRLAILEIIDFDYCAIRISTTSPDKELCAHGIDGRMAPCRGDSGGPLVLGQKADSVLVGLVSFGTTRDCEKGKAEVFTKVSAFVPWIEKNAAMGHLRYI